MKNFVLYTIFVLVVVFVTATSSSASDLNIGDKAVDFPEGKEWFGGERVSIEDNIGKKVTLIYFMKPGCGSCDKFAPHLYRLMLKNKDTLSVVGVTEFPTDKIEEYLQNKMGDYPIMQDLDRSFMNKYIGVINKYPYVAIIGKDGKLAWYGRGKFHSHVTEELDRALGETEVAAPVVSKGDKYAIAVGVDHTELLANSLVSPENNVELVADSFKDAGYKGVGILLGSEATKESFKKSIADIATQAGKDDTVVIYFSGEANPTTPGDGSVQLNIYLADSALPVGELVKDFKEQSECENLFVVIDANTENSSLKIWEDIAADVGKGVDGATVMLSAARWDRSMLNDSKDHTIFSEMFADNITESDGALTPSILWRDIRESMSEWSRPKGILQSPFIVNSKEFSIGKAN